MDQPNRLVRDANSKTDNRFPKVGALAGVLGVLIQFVAGALHPGHAAPNDSAAVFQEYAASPIWTSVHIGQFAGGLLVALFFVLVAVSLPKNGFGGAFAVIGAVAAVLLGAVFSVQMAVDGVALKGAIDAWSGAPTADRSAAFLVAEAVRDLEKGLSGFFHLLNGTTMLALGAAIASVREHRRWLGWFGIAAGIGFMAGGVATAHTGFSPEAGQILSPALLAGLVFVFGMAAAMWRGSSSAADRGAAFPVLADKLGRNSAAL